MRYPEPDPHTRCVRLPERIIEDLRRVARAAPGLETADTLAAKLIDRDLKAALARLVDTPTVSSGGLRDGTLGGRHGRSTRGGEP